MTLEDKINQTRISRASFTPQCISVVALAALKALQYLHSNGVLHRDIKVSIVDFFTDTGSQIIYSFRGPKIPQFRMKSK
jgi:serine/threonine protein kinase